MSKEELINNKFEESVGGLNENFLTSHEDWYTYVNKLPIDQRIVYIKNQGNVSLYLFCTF